MSKSIIGLTIRKVRVATRVEREASGVDDERSTRVIELSDGTCILAMADAEGNGFGTMLHIAPSQNPMSEDALTGFYL